MWGLHNGEKETPKMATFISCLWQKYKAYERGSQNSLTDERIAQVQEIGFVFDGEKSPKI